MPSSLLPVGLALVWLVAGSALADSQILLDRPQESGPIAAATYDDEGRRIGDATLAVRWSEDGSVLLESISRLDSGSQMTARAILAPVPGETRMRLVQQQSESLDDTGESFGVLTVDHRRARASCTSPDGDVLSEVALPPQDRVVNVPMNLFFLPLVRGQHKRLGFQIVLCRPEARLVDFEAWVEPSLDAKRAVEVRYAPDMGMASLVARALAPRLVFWFDPAEPHAWAAHRLPLYSGGPEITVIRDDVPRRALAR